ncbi:hypothetical protein ADUPG1_007590, partial [Aduncisulcus paluster]
MYAFSSASAFLHGNANSNACPVLLSLKA